MSRRRQFGAAVPVVALGAVALLLTTGVGCGSPHARIPFTEPAPMSFGGASELSIVQVEGRRRDREEFREDFVRELRRQARDDGYWTVNDKTHLDATISSSGVASVQPGEREVLLRLDVHMYETQRRDYEYQVRERDADGNTHTRTEMRPGHEGRCVFSVYSVHGDGYSVMTGTEYETSERVRRDDPQRAQQRALRLAVREFLDEITPRIRITRVRLDDQHDDMGDVINLARSREYAQAANMLEAMREQYPERPDVLYNLAVMYDAMGDYERAGRLYDEAIRLSGRDFYVRTRNDFESRRRAAEEMTQ